MLEAAAFFLLANLIVGMARIWLGPGPADRVQGVLLVGTSMVATLLLMAYAGARDSLVNVALVFVMLAAWLAVAFAAAPDAPRDEQQP